MGHGGVTPIQSKNPPPRRRDSEVREEIIFLKQLPPFPVMADRILGLPDEIDIGELASAIELDPPLAARILGLANAAFFGWPGGIHTIYDAIYKVLGLRTVRGLALGLIMSGVFPTERCRGFNLELYWFTSLVTGLMAQGLVRHLPPPLRGGVDNVYLNGLLHNLGLLALVHLFPQDMEHIFTTADDRGDRPLSERVREALGMDQRIAGGLLGRKWHLPGDIVSVIEHHDDRFYRGVHWPIAMLVGYCAREAKGLFFETVVEDGADIPAMLGIGKKSSDSERNGIRKRIEGVRELAALLSGKGTRHV